MFITLVCILNFVGECDRSITTQSLRVHLKSCISLMFISHNIFLNAAVLITCRIYTWDLLHEYIFVTYPFLGFKAKTISM